MLNIVIPFGIDSNFRHNIPFEKNNNLYLIRAMVGISLSTQSAHFMFPKVKHIIYKQSESLRFRLIPDSSIKWNRGSHSHFGNDSNAKSPRTAQAMTMHLPGVKRHILTILFPFLSLCRCYKLIMNEKRHLYR